MSTEGTAPSGVNRLKIPKLATIPVSGPQRHEATLLLPLDASESCQSAVPGTSAPRLIVTVAPLCQS
eukprot:8720782-Pyramimonas_sp.AAC.1